MDFNEFKNRFHVRLNDQQMAAVQAIDGPVLLLAVPGSGKTTTLVTRLGYMVFCRRIAPEQILTLTYTVAAAKDMSSRFHAIFGEDAAPNLSFRTINGICSRMIWYFAKCTGHTPYALLSDEKESAPVLTAVFREATGEYPTEADIQNVRALITYSKNMMLDEEGIRALDEQAGFPFADLFHKYNAWLKSQKRIDFDDQMVYARKILLRYPQVLEQFRARYPYICVDEAQDTSKIQHEIISMLAGPDANLFMVGDEDQSIYGFRAAYPEALLSFQDRYTDAKVLLMEENFRSNAAIVAAADAFIRKNRLRHPKNMRAARPKGADIRFIDLRGRGAQYTWLAKVASSASGSGTTTAVLYRNNESMIPLADLLERNGTSFRLRAADQVFFTHRTIMDIRNIFTFSKNPQDTGLFQKTYYKCSTYLSKKETAEACTISLEKKIPVLDAALRYLDLRPQVARSVKNMKRSLSELRTDSASEAITRIMGEIGYADYLERANLSDGKIQILRALSYRESAPDALFARLDYLKDLLKNREDDPSSHFILSTIHGSKGLEYDTVYLMDVADGIFPQNVPDHLSHMSEEEQKAWEEERRIFYVGMTRARDQLNVFTFGRDSVLVSQLKKAAGAEKTASAVVRNTAGTEQHGGRNNSERISAVRKAGTQQKGSITDNMRTVQIPAEEDPGYQEFVSQLGTGLAVIHKTYGPGVIAEIQEPHVVIAFDTGISKTFSLPILYSRNLLSENEEE